MPFARVALPLALPEALSYAIPSSDASLVTPGVRVRVRLRGAVRVGLVVDVVDDPGCPIDRVRDLEEVLDPRPLLPAHVMDLVRFAADYYAAPVGTMVRAAVPAPLLRLPPPMVRVGPRAHEVLPTLEGDERRLLERIMQASRLTLARLRREGWSAARLEAILPALAVRRALTVVERDAGVDAHGSVGAVVLAELDPAERAARLGRAPAQQRVVAWLEELGRPALEAELTSACGCSAAVVAQLVRKGLVRRFRQPRPAGRRWELAAPSVPEHLTPHQELAVGRVGEALAAGGYRAFLLHGVTGSGKTEVYLRLAAAAAAAGRQALVLVPEIALTPAVAGQLSARFGDRVAVLHSALAEGERFVAWQRARRGEVDVVAGPRSALWAPLDRLGLIVVDEEQESSYKQEEEPRYHARDLALWLGQRLAVPVVLASATPSLEALWLARQQRLEVIELPERVAGGQLPLVEVVDLRGEEPEPGEHGQRFLARRTRELLVATVERDEQAIVLVNRRGWAPVLLCRECGHQASCTDCSVPLTVHRRRAVLLCHYCGHQTAIPARCERCNGELLDHVGAGTEKIAERVRALLPGTRVDILDRDTARSPAQLVATLERFGAGESRVLVGTQMVSKGHHFPQVTLTVVVNADNLLGFPDFRGAERTFQMLTQLAGRAGRGERPGTVVIQTYHPDHHAVRAAVEHDVERFAAEELRYRQAFRYPPAARLALVRYEGEGEQATLAAAERGVAALAGVAGGLRVIGPAPAPLARLRGKWRVHVLLLAPGRPPLRDALSRIVALPLPSDVRRVVDVDPQSTV
ncbi:MAG: replication restart helicase PriA [Acidobacteria bacterium]|nr:replication restart helicase PriA [Acidobacteriota bacterium]